MSETISAKDYVEALASEVKYAADSAFNDLEELLQNINSIMLHYDETKDEYDKRYVLSSGMMLISSNIMLLELISNNIERLINIIELTSRLSGLNESDAKLIQKEGKAVFDKYIKFVDDCYLMLDFHDKTISQGEEAYLKMVSESTVYVKTLKTMTENILKNYAKLRRR